MNKVSSATPRRLYSLAGELSSLTSDRALGATVHVVGPSLPWSIQSVSP